MILCLPELLLFGLWFLTFSRHLAPTDAKIHSKSLVGLLNDASQYHGKKNACDFKVINTDKCTYIYVPT